MRAQPSLPPRKRRFERAKPKRLLRHSSLRTLYKTPPPAPHSDGDPGKVVGHVDLTGDGEEETTVYDTVGDGKGDALDTTGDGKIDTLLKKL